MSAALETLRCLRPNVPVEINFGLGAGSVPNSMTPERRLAHLQTLLPQIMQAGYSAHVIKASPEEYEDTLVVHGSFNTQACTTTLLWEQLEFLGQDCCSLQYTPQYIRRGPSGDDGWSLCFGPRAERWPFDDLLFKSLIRSVSALAKVFYFDELHPAESYWAYSALTSATCQEDFDMALSDYGLYQIESEEYLPFTNIQERLRDYYAS